MNINKLTLGHPEYPQALTHLHSKPKQLYVTGSTFAELMKRPRIAIVGTRRPTPYGRTVTEHFARELAEQGIVIISGLALGVDAIAHRAALAAGGTCLVVLPSPLERIVPATNRRLAQQILDQGGALVSEYSSEDTTFKTNFVARNRIVAGLADAVLITEAGVASGTRHTVRFASDLGLNIMAIPGNIDRPASVGSNRYIKNKEAKLVIEPKDVLSELGVKPHKTKIRQIRGANADEQKLLDLMLRGITDGQELLAGSGLSVSKYNQAMTMMEITDKVKPLGANHWGLY